MPVPVDPPKTDNVIPFRKRKERAAVTLPLVPPVTIPQGLSPELADLEKEWTKLHDAWEQLEQEGAPASAVEAAKFTAMEYLYEIYDAPTKTWSDFILKCEAVVKYGRLNYDDPRTKRGGTDEILCLILAVDDLSDIIDPPQDAS